MNESRSSLNALGRASSNDLDQLAVVGGYIQYCEETCVPNVYPNNKPWLSKSLNSTLNKKKLSYQTGGVLERKQANKEVTQEIKTSTIKKKEEEKFSGSIKSTWGHKNYGEGAR